MVKLKRVLPYDVKVTSSENGGVLVQIGCVTFSFSNGQDSLDLLTEYLTDPKAAIKRYKNSYSIDISYTMDDAGTGGQIGVLSGTIPSGLSFS